MSGLTLKEKLLKQKKKLEKSPQVQNILIEKSVKKLVPKYMPNLLTLDKRRDENEDVKEMLENFLNDVDEGSVNLQKLVNNKSSYNFKKFISSFIRLSPKLQKKFIKAYLKQDVEYSIFYDQWYAKNKDKIVEYLEEQSSDVGSVDLRKELIQKALLYAEENGVELDDSDKKSYYKIVEKIQEQVDDDVNAILTSKYIKFLKKKGIENPENMDLGDFLETYKKMKKKGGKGSKSVDISSSNIPSSNLPSVKLPSKRKNKDDYKDAFDIDKMISLTPKRSVKNKIKIGSKHIDEEVVNLSKKIVKITKNKDKFKKYIKMPLEKLKNIYDNLSKEGVYIEEFNKQDIINKLVSLTNKNREFYENKSFKEVKRIFDTLKEPEIKEITDYKKYPWIIPSPVAKVWIHTDDSSFYYKGIYQKYFGAKYYRPRNNFFLLMTNSNAVKTQKNRKLTVTLDDKTFTFMILFNLRNGEYIFQDEDVFQKEQEYFLKSYTDQASEIEKFLDEKITDKSIDISVAFLEYSLKDQKDVEMDYIKNVVKNAVKNTELNKDLFFVISGIIAYLDNEVFKERIKNNYYTPDILILLTPEEKMNDSMDVDYIVKKQEEIIYEMGKNNFFDPTQRKKTKQDFNIAKRSVSSDSGCKNNLGGVPKINIVKYNNYCYDIMVLKERFSEGNYKIPKKKGNFDEEFIKQINNITIPEVNLDDLFGKDDDAQVEQEDTQVETYENSDLLKMIKIALKEQEKNKAEMGFGDDKEEDGENKEDSSEGSSDGSSESSSDDSESSETSSEGSSESSSEGSSEESSESSDKTNKEQSKMPLDAGNKGKCSKCSKDIDADKEFKSIECTKGGCSPVYFCSLKCMEEYHFKK